MMTWGSTNFVNLLNPNVMLKRNSMGDFIFMFKEVVFEIILLAYHTPCFMLPLLFFYWTKTFLTPSLICVLMAYLFEKAQGRERLTIKLKVCYKKNNITIMRWFSD